ncbi:EB1 protein (macronuclear) [Tetrahymena thermophila SB210]|uniref:EB1 protein n=1 Tax=Tetrahymena thermophila (strain SB210) TaxID=312017 RepID=I7M845_TETTS|nr:EB1 protein [Tetrahymena thermophila SB210]EAR97141.2 EB1 protein [Tetrahymena thermophila SB210]|eukprot:XP_001017386.2 EB1 protein [Tetrahymena thermophila SB210]
MSHTNSASSAKKSSVIGKNFISKNEILAWINDLLKVNMTLIEQLGSGTMYCQLLDVIYPGQVPLSKVKWTAKLEYDFLHNFKILQQTFDKLQVPKMIPVNKLAKAKYQDNLEFAQWMKAYFDINCKEKGRGYDALKRRGNVVPYFGFCKGGVLPKQTLFFRNPNEKLTLDDFSSSSFSSQHEPEFPESESYSSNNNVQGLFKSESTPLKQSSFFSNNSPQSSSCGSAQIKQQSYQMNPPKQSASLNQTSNSFFQRGEQNQSITPKNSFFEAGNSNKEFSQFFGKSEGQKTQDNTCSFFQKEKLQSELNDQNQNKFIANKYGNQGNQNNQGTSIIESSFFSKQRAQNFNSQSNQNNFFNINNEKDFDAASSNNSNKFSCDKSYEKKTPSLSTSNLLSKFQQLTEVSQILLKKNSETSEKSNLDIFQKQSQYEDKSPSNSNLQITKEVKLDFQGDSFFKKDISQNKQQQQFDDQEKPQAETINHQQNCQFEEKNFKDNFFKAEQKNQNNIFNCNENKIVNEKPGQINQSNSFSQQSDSQESNILYRNICSQESASNQECDRNQNGEYQNNTNSNSIQIQQNITEDVSSSFSKLEKNDKINQIQNNLDDLDSQNSYETPICKKQKKNEDNENFSKGSERYNQTTVQINNKEDLDQTLQAENNFVKNSSNKDKILKIFQIIQLCQCDYDSAMNQILNVIQN